MKKKQTVHHSCGCNEEHEFTGTEDENKRMAAWFATKPCKKCWQKQKQVERDEETTRAENLAKSQNLPPLAGTEKQVPWGNRIRQRLIDALAEITKMSKPEDADVIAKFQEAFATNVIVQDNAGWFIDHSDLESIPALRAQLNAWIAEANETKASG